jgi:hypothetical protein
MPLSPPSYNVEVYRNIVIRITSVSLGHRVTPKMLVGLTGIANTCLQLYIPKTINYSQYWSFISTCCSYKTVLVNS